MLRLISIGIPAAFIASAIGALYIYRDLSAERTEWARADVYRALQGDVAAQMEMAHCYDVGCSYAPRDRVYACAWYEVISQEEGPTANASELSKERQTCDSVKGWNRQYISVAVNEIHRELKLEAPNHGLDSAHK